MKTDRELLTQIMVSVQKARSNLMELELPESLLETTNPWLFGDQCILIAIEKLEECEDDMDLIGGIYNLLTIIDMFEPLIGMVAVTYGPALPYPTDYMSARMA